MSESPIPSAALQSVLPTVLHESGDWLVVNKPAGWLTIPGREPGPPVLNEWAREGRGEIWVTHRIDRETSGVLLFAKTAKAHTQANGWFQNHQMKKGYDAFVQGQVALPVFRVKDSIEGASAATQFEVKESFKTGAFWVRAIPVTGKRHQIRIHLAKQGFPILGDVKYGGPRGLPGVEAAFERVALHARVLQLPTGEVFEAPWPEDFVRWHAALGGRL